MRGENMKKLRGLLGNKKTIYSIAALLIISGAILFYYIRSGNLFAESSPSSHCSTNTLIKDWATLFTENGDRYYGQFKMGLVHPDKTSIDSVYILKGGKIYYTNGAKYVTDPGTKNGNVVLRSGGFYYSADPAYSVDVSSQIATTTATPTATAAATQSLVGLDQVGQLAQWEPYHTFNGGLYYGLPQGRVNGHEQKPPFYGKSIMTASTKPNGVIMNIDNKVVLCIPSKGLVEIDSGRTARPLLKDDSVPVPFRVKVVDFTTQIELPIVGGLYQAKANKVVQFIAEWTGDRLVSGDGTIRVVAGESYAQATADGGIHKNTYIMTRATENGEYAMFDMTFQGQGNITYSATAILQVGN